MHIDYWFSTSTAAAMKPAQAAHTTHVSVVQKCGYVEIKLYPGEEEDNCSWRIMFRDENETGCAQIWI